MSQQVINLPLPGLKCHPRNDEFFSNVEGEEFNRLKQSIQELGILTPLRVSADMTIISGHQRYRAAKELGFIEVPVIVDKGLVNDDEKVVQLIAANFGRMKNDPVKQGRWIAEYERLRGVRRGNNQHTSMPNNSVSSQKILAEELGVSVDTLQNLKKLNDIIPEFREIISDGRISATTGFKLVARLSVDEQHELLNLLPENEKLTQSKVQTYIKQISGLETENASLKTNNKDAEDVANHWKIEAQNAKDAIEAGSDSEKYLEMVDKTAEANETARIKSEEAYRLKIQVEELQNKLEEATKPTPPVIRTEIKEVIKEVKVIPDDYEHLKKMEAIYNKFHEYNNLDPSKVGFLGTPEEEQRNFEARYSDFLGGITSDFEGLAAEKDRLCKMPSDHQRYFVDQMSRIMEIIQEVLPELDITKEVA